MNSIEQSRHLLLVAAHHSLKDLKAAYLKLAKQYHPDQFQDNLEQQEATIIFQEITEAYNDLKSNPTSRDGQSQTASRGSEPRSTQIISQKSSPEFYYEQASLLAHQHEYPQAVEALNQALKINPLYAQAYEFRGHLKSLLGLERQATSDLANAERLRLGQKIAKPTGDTPHSREVQWTSNGRTPKELKSPVALGWFTRIWLSVKPHNRQPLLLIMGMVLTLSLGYWAGRPSLSPSRNLDMNQASTEAQSTP